MSKKPLPPIEPISGKDLRRYLDTQDDFAFELEAYRHALGFGFKASHAGLYDDAITKRRRQYDVRAFHEIGNRRIELTIECKSLDPTYPLLIQRVPRPGNESFHQIMLSRTANTAYGNLREPQGWVGAALFTMSGTHMYDAGQLVGKSMKRVRVTGDTFAATDRDVYEGYTQALTSMNEVVQVAARDLRVQYAPGSEKARAFVPIVVVSDGALWIADYSSSAQLIGDPRPEPNEVTFYLGWDYELPNVRDVAHPATFTISHFHIMTRSRLPLFLKEIQERGLIWDQLFGSPNA
jgi:hypothetical protein